MVEMVQKSAKEYVTITWDNSNKNTIVYVGGLDHCAVYMRNDL